MVTKPSGGIGLDSAQWKAVNALADNLPPRRPPLRAVGGD
jgi:hypothetical protein